MMPFTILPGAVLAIAIGQTSFIDTPIVQDPTQPLWLFFARALDVKDVNNDGILDVAVGHTGYINGQGAVWVCYGPDFKNRVVATSPALPLNGALGDHGLRLADLNGDGHVDILSAADYASYGGAANAGRAYLFYGPNFSQFTEIVPPLPPQTEQSFGVYLDVGDLTGDGIADALIGCPYYNATQGYLALYDGTVGFGNGPIKIITPQVPINPSGPKYGNGLRIVDVDGDGVNDVITPGGVAPPTSPYVSHVHWLKSGNPGAAVFFPLFLSMNSTNLSRRFEFVDMNQDGIRDLVSAATSISSPYPGQVVIQYGPAYTSFAIAKPNLPQTDAWFFSIGDIDRDGHQDVAIGAPLKFNSGLLSICYGPAYTTKQEFVGGIGTELGWDVKVVDLDGDGFSEVLASDPAAGFGTVHIYTHKSLRVHSGPGDVSLSVGGSVQLSLEAGKLSANASYLILMSLSGSTPGLTWSSFGAQHHLPINLDAATTAGLGFVNTPVFTGFLGQLDASGKALASFNVPAGSQGSGLAGATLTFAAVLSSNGSAADYATHAVAVPLKP